MISMNMISTRDTSSIGNPSSVNAGAGMTSWIHFGTLDAVLFEAWRPATLSALAAACVGLVAFGVLERGLAAFRRAQEVRWRARPVSTSLSTKSVADNGMDSREALLVVRREGTPFVASHEVPRGVLQAAQSTLTYALMLVVMTYNGAYIISIVLGLGIGEVLFGRI